MAHGDITHVDIPADDMQRATTFYRTVFGWDAQEYPGYEGYPMWRAPNQISGGGFGPRGGDLQVPRSTIEVDSIEEALAAIEANGGKVVRGKEEISPTSWWAVFEDSEGNQMGLYEGTTDASDAG
ncbi:VOC family protein [Cellulomonas septica]|uniref:VOC family protein n=1 Tax=Cellulomonas septica TaxID=285080 RepID=A0ABX1K5K3_9CELL|nr:VOC family protein [Cellulomonas septica]NKY40866.1 VOC family protein [Cellulomonas septica]